MGIDPCVFFGASPAELLDPILFAIGIKMIDMEKLERFVNPNKGESIRDATLRKFGQTGVDVVLSNLGKELL
jgi:hypothetical protein